MSGGRTAQELRQKRLRKIGQRRAWVELARRYREEYLELLNRHIRELREEEAKGTLSI